MKWVAVSLAVLGLLAVREHVPAAAPSESNVASISVAKSFPRYTGPHFDMDPTASELLATPIDLDCEGISVIEWRPSINQSKFTGPNQENIEILNRLCRLAISKFPEFARLQKIKINDQPTNEFSQFISLMPFQGAEGHRSRNLNDDMRFAERTKFYDSANRELPIWGWTGYKNKTIFVRNDVPSREFSIVFLHELYHAQSHHYGIYDNLKNPSHDDEILAHKFTDYLGFKL